MPLNILANKTSKYPTVYRRTRIVEQNEHRTRYVSQQRSLDKINTFTSTYIRPSGEKGGGGAVFRKLARNAPVAMQDVKMYYYITYARPRN